MRKLGMALMLALVCFVFGTASAIADEYICTGTTGAITVENLKVPSGATCALNRTLLQGNILVERNASLNANAVTVGGNIFGEGFQSVTVRNNSRITGSIQLKQGNRSTVTDSFVNGSIQFEENRGASIARNSNVGSALQAYKNSGRVEFSNNPFVRDNVQAYENTGGTNITGNRTDGNLQVYKSSGGISITNNVIAQNFQCVDNQSPLVENGNTVGGDRECSSF